MGVRETIESLPDTVRDKLERFKDTRNRFEDERNGKAYKEYQDMTRGYISCLMDTGIITQAQFRQLYIYYGTM